MNVAIIGCGLIGNKRAKALGDDKLVFAVDSDPGRAQKLASQYAACEVCTDIAKVVTSPGVDIVIVATTNDVLASATHAAVKGRKHVLVEKPAARNADELVPVEKTAAANGVIVKVGFNHRFHPALLKAHEIFETGALGPMMFIRGRYGHGGRLGMEKEWRGNPAISGGGEMLDQGVHLIDLSRWFLGDFATTTGRVENYFWNWPVEDNGFAMLRTEAGQVAWLHASCSEWKNLFSFEIYGKVGKLHIEGLGGSYGVERLAYYKMLPQMGPPETTIWEYPGDDTSWKAEYKHFKECIASKTQPSGNLADAIAAMRIVESLYAQSKQS